MPFGENLARCFGCGTTFICGDCIETYCPQCKCKQYGHLRIPAIEDDFCGRCGCRLDPKTGEEIYRSQ